MGCVYAPEFGGLGGTRGLATGRGRDREGSSGNVIEELERRGFVAALTR